MPTSSSWTATRSLTCPRLATCAASSSAATITCPTPASSMSALQARRSPPRNTGSTCACSPRQPAGGRPSRAFLRSNRGRAATAVHHPLESLEIRVDGTEPGRAQVAELLVERDDVADVVLPAGVFLRRRMQPPAGQLGIAVLSHTLPGCLDDRVLGADGIIIQVPAARREPVEDLGEQALLALIGQMVHEQ